MYKDKRKVAEKQEQSNQVERQLVQRLWPVLVNLNQKLDRRLVKTFLGLVMAIIIHPPLYRLRFALSLLWLTHPPPFFSYL